MDSQNNNIKLIQIFSDEWINKKEIVKSRIKNLIGVNENKIYARKCTIKEITNNDYILFLYNNHLQGYNSAKIKLGLFYNDELISIMSFSKSRYNKKYEYEIIRYCNKINYSIIGGFNKLFSCR